MQFQVIKTFLAVLGMCLANSDSDKNVNTNSTVEFILHNQNYWMERKFLNHGIFQPVAENEDLFAFSQSFYHSPVYTVLESNLGNEEHICVRLENTKSVHLRVYGTSHPDAPHYKIDLMEPPLIQKCSKERECQDLDNCEPGNISSNNISFLNNVVCVSWDTTDKRRTMLVQYQNILLRCLEHSLDLLEIKKLVMEGPKTQNISIARVDYLYTTEDRKTVLYDNINASYRSLNFFVSQCITCETRFKLYCDDEVPITATVSNNSSQQVNFQNSVMINGWASVRLSHPRNGSDCILVVYTKQHKSQFEVMPYWAHTRRAYLRYENGTDPPAPENCCDEVLRYKIGFVVCLVLLLATLIGVIFYIVKKKYYPRFLQRSYTPADHEDELETIDKTKQGQTSSLPLEPIVNS